MYNEKTDVEQVSKNSLPKNLMSCFKEFAVKRLEGFILFFYFDLSPKIQNCIRE